MKKTILATSLILSILGFSFLVHAAGPTVTIAPVSAITLPTSAVTLTASATPTAPQAIANYNWALTSGPTLSPAPVITPNATNPVNTSTIQVTGLTIPGSYVFTATATDNTTPTAQISTATVTVVVNAKPIPTPLPVINKNMKIQIDGNGKAEIQGSLESINGTVLAVKAWGITFTVNTATTKFDGRVTDLSLFKVGDYVRVKGTLDATQNLTVNARSIKNTTVASWKDGKNREDEKKRENEKHENEDKLKTIAGKVFGGEHNKGEKEDR